MDINENSKTAYFHLPGLFEFYELYRIFLPIFFSHREWFYDWCDIGSIYGAPADCLWGGGRVGFGYDNHKSVLKLMQEFGISARLTFSNSLLEEHHLNDRQCNGLCKEFENSQGGCEGITLNLNSQGDCDEIIPNSKTENGIIVHSDLLAEYLLKNYPGLYLVSSTTKVITDFKAFSNELDRDEFRYVVADFRLNHQIGELEKLSAKQKAKVEFLCNECCYFGCSDRKACYENVSKKVLGLDCQDHICKAPGATDGYVFSKAKENPGFIGIDDIVNTYLPMGFSHFKIEGRSLGSALVLEFIIYYMTKPDYQLKLREAIYLDSSLDLF